MKQNFRLLAVVSASLLVAGAAVFSLPPARAAAPADAPDHLVHAGAKDPTNPNSAHMFETYYPRHLRVHKGDRVRWEFPNQGNLAQAFHTVTFGDPDALPYVRADEASGTLAFDERTFFTSGCGRPGQPVCVVSSTDQIVSSGTPIQHTVSLGAIQPFDAVIDLPPGTYSYFCTLHHPDMTGTVEVVKDHVRVNNPPPANFTAEIAAAAKRADATFAEEAKTSVVTEKGRRVWTVDAGAGTGGNVRVSTEAFLPSALDVRAGDTVRWVMGGTAHAITFPDTAPAGGPPQHLTANCEFDGPGTGAPGVPVIGLVGTRGLPWCPPGGSIEIALTPLASSEHRAPDDAVVSPATLHNSGILIGGRLPERMRGKPPRSGSHFPSTFEATFPVPGTYAYRCMIHWEFMGGSVTVR